MTTGNGCSGAGREFQVPWCPHHQRAIMVQTHQDRREEGMTTLFPLRRLKRFGMGPQILKKLYVCSIESILTCCITAWFGKCSASDRKALQRVVRMAQYITGAKLPAVQDLYTRWCQRKAQNIVKDSRHPSYRLCHLIVFLFIRFLSRKYFLKPYFLNCIIGSGLASEHFTVRSTSVLSGACDKYNLI